MNAPVRLSSSVDVIDLHDDRQAQRIEAYVTEQAGDLFHRPNWLLAVESGTGQSATGLVCQRMGVITGWLPLTQVRSVLFGKALVSSGFGVGGGILSDCEESAGALAQAAEKLAMNDGIPGIEVRGGHIPTDWNSWNDRHAGFVRELAEDDEAQLLAIPRKARAEVRKGLKNELEVKVGRSAEDRAGHYAVYSESVRNLGTPVFPKSLFDAMLDAFPDTSDILTVSLRGKPISSVLSFYHGGAVMPYWGGGTIAARGARANERMYYELMLHARNRGMSRFDFGRSKAGSGPYAFKKNWGFEPQPLVYGAWSKPGSTVRDVDPTSAAYSRKIALWKKLPLPLANMIGPWIARGLA